MSALDRRQRLALAVRRDARLMRAVHPIAFPLVQAVPGPVRRVPGLGVVVKDAALVRQVLLDGEGFSKQGKGASSDLWTPVLGARVLVNMHGEDHRSLRRRLAPIFSPAFVEPLVQETLGEGAAELERRLLAGERVDLAAHARQSASAAIALLVGLERSAVDDRLFRQIAGITGMVRLSRPTLTAAQVRSARAVLDALGEHAAAAFRGDESTVPGRLRGLGLSEDEALGAVGAFVLTGTETIAAAIPRIVALLADSGTLGEPSDDEAAERATAEGLRWTTPTPVMLRSTLARRSIGPVAVAPGDRIIIATYAADRAAGGFDPASDRAVGLKQLWFGAGAHFCIGAPLAMAEIRLALAALRRVEAAGRAIRVVERAPARHQLLPGYARLVLEARP
ncbi:cytochrome P450 [Agrococcus sp. ARC_14]|uniref:cytochrome P450 n=1 Tax=Agrococcus sp. ARC_14 TaxID=2919927 RepID=UPI001F06EC9E|nr:cytochrome P450 [Agrococcus sp. ARC_14]MCH1882422.1 cytochrome P450 [Agrococcus sp. ARC_14]